MHVVAYHTERPSVFSNNAAENKNKINKSRQQPTKNNQPTLFFFFFATNPFDNQ